MLEDGWLGLAISVAVLAALWTASKHGCSTALARKPPNRLLLAAPAAANRPLTNEGVLSVRARWLGTLGGILHIIQDAVMPGQCCDAGHQVLPSPAGHGGAVSCTAHCLGQVHRQHQLCALHICHQAGAAPAWHDEGSGGGVGGRADGLQRHVPVVCSSDGLGPSL